MHTKLIIEEDTRGRWSKGDECHGSRLTINYFHTMPRVYIIDRCLDDSRK